MGPLKSLPLQSTCPHAHPHAYPHAYLQCHLHRQHHHYHMDGLIRQDCIQATVPM